MAIRAVDILAGGSVLVVVIAASAVQWFRLMTLRADAQRAGSGADAAARWAEECRWVQNALIVVVLAVAAGWALALGAPAIAPLYVAGLVITPVVLSQALNRAILRMWAAALFGTAPAPVSEPLWRPVWPPLRPSQEE